MTAEKSSLRFWIGLCLLIFITPLAQSQVTIDLTPITYPIVLPDSGGSFDYLLTINNQGAAITATVWCTVTLPNGNSWGPTAGPAILTLGAGQTQGYYRVQALPPRAPDGYFALHAYAGIYPDSIWAQDQFEFQKQEVSGTEQIWEARYNGPGNGDDYAFHVALDASGNVYVGGRCWGGESQWDYGTIKCDAEGNQLWAACYNGPGNGLDYATSLAVDSDGNVYVTGGSLGSGTDYDYATIKYSPFGIPLWVARYNGSILYDTGTALAVDASGNVYVTGSSRGSTSDYDYTTVKYNASGHQIWVRSYNGPGNYYDFPTALALDGAGNVYVAGTSASGASVMTCDYATLKYDADGNQIWVARYNGPGNDHDEAFSLSLDGSGNVYITGTSLGSGTASDYATLKYDSNGNQLWEARYNGPGNGNDEAHSLALDSSGNVFVTGDSPGLGTGADYATIAYDANGNQLWVSRYDGPMHSSDEAISLVVDSGGNVYVTGGSHGIGSYADYATIKYDASGNQVWVARYNGPGNNQDAAWDIALDDGGNVYVTGSGMGSGYDEDYCTIKYSGGNLENWMPVEATLLGQSLPKECRLEGNFPNPFNSQTVARYELRVASVVSLRVYDTAGRLVAILVDGWRSAGEHELTWDAKDLPSGMYFARLEAGEFSQVQKLILLK